MRCASLCYPRALKGKTHRALKLALMLALEAMGLWLGSLSIAHHHERGLAKHRAKLGGMTHHEVDAQPSRPASPPWAILHRTPDGHPLVRLCQMPSWKGSLALD